MRNKSLSGVKVPRHKLRDSIDLAEPKVISWKALYGNKFLRKLSPQMLSTEGEKVNQLVPEYTRSGERETLTTKVPCVVVYDEEYVIEKLRMVFSEFIGVFPVQTLQEIVAQAVDPKNNGSYPST